jgi:glutathione synthase
MDPMSRINPDKDTTYAFQRAAQARGHEALHCMSHELWVEGDEIGATARTVRVHPEAPYATHGEPSQVLLRDVACVFVRKDPPFDDDYLYATLLLEHARGKTLVVNDPRGLRDANEKLYATHFAKHMPRFTVTSDRDRVFQFVRAHGGKGVIKPLHGAGGASVMMVVLGDDNARSIVDTITNEGKRLAMIQEYLPAVRQGDKRVLLLDGQILGAINRVPRSDDLRSNIHVGGRVEPCEVTDEERAIVTDIAPKLLADGLMFVGLDVIGGKLTEVNVTSPTGIQELSHHRGRDMAADVIEWAERKARARG